VEWLNGKGLDQTESRTPLRSFKQPGSAYDDKTLGKDPQVGHMRDYVTAAIHGSQKYINSGILNRAFYEVSMRITTKRATEIWVAALRELPNAPNSDFFDFAGVLHRQGRDSGEKQEILQGLKNVGLDPALRSHR